MKVNKLGFLSLLTILGLLGLATDNRGFLGFFGFAYYIRYFFVTPDEMFMQNVRRAASIGFFSGVIVTGIATVLRVAFPVFISSRAVLAAGYAVSVFCFTIVLMMSEIKEQLG